MSRLLCIMCITNEGTYEKGRIDDRHLYTIDRITVKMSDGRRLKRYAVCVNGRWESNQQMTLREARQKVEELKQEYTKPEFKPVPEAVLREYASLHGAQAAHDLLLLGGYGMFAGTGKEYDALLEEFRKAAKTVVS